MKSSISSSTFQRTIRGALIAALAGAALSISPVASAQNTVNQRSVTTTSNGESSVRVESQNGRYTITLDGKEVKSGSLSDAWTTFDLVNEAGDSVGTVTRDGDEFGIALDDEMPSLKGLGHVERDHLNALMAERDAAQAARSGVARAYGVGAGQYAATAGAWGGTPRVMLGVTLDSPGEALSAQLGINRETSTVLSTVTDDLPAAKAGLKIYDVITEVNGEPASPDTLRRFLREKNAGDTLALKVISGAVRKDVSVTLEAYDAARLNTTIAGAWSPGASAGGTFTVDLFDRQLQEKSRRLEELGRLLADKSTAMQKAGNDAKALEDLGEQMNKIGEEMNKIGEEMSRSGPGNWNIYPGGGQAGVSRTIIGRRNGPGGSMPFVVPAPPPASAVPEPLGGIAGLTTLHNTEAAALKERMDKMDERLAKLTELLEKVAEQKSASAGGTTEKKDN